MGYFAGGRGGLRFFGYELWWINHGSRSRGVRVGGRGAITAIGDGSFLPIFEPYKDTATIHRDQHDYSLFYDQVFGYEAGKTDVYRINVKVANSEEPGMYRGRLKIDHTSDGIHRTAFSDSFLIGKCFWWYDEQKRVRQIPQRRTSAR
jgi:hypothetical protein